MKKKLYHKIFIYANTLKWLLGDNYNTIKAYFRYKWNTIILLKKEKYREKNIELLYEKIKEYDIVSFDIFDTLITRKVENPSNIYKLMRSINKTIDEKWLNYRTEAEYRARKKQKKDININDIYDYIYDIKKYKKNYIMNLEINIEKNIVIARSDMLELYNRLKKNGKEIWLISDMYLDKKTITYMLKKCGIENYSKLLISNEINKRKDTSEVWMYLNEYIKDKKLIHIGDNYKSDFINPKKNNIDAAFIYNSYLYQKVSLIGNFAKWSKYNKIGDNITKGLIFNKKIFNSPFFNERMYRFSLKDIGYIVFGPIILEFCIWLYENTKEKKYDSIWFFSREGFYIKRFYDEVVCFLNGETPNTQYFLTSRVAAATASFMDKSDIKTYLENGYFHGTISDLLENRFSLSMEIENDRKVFLPKDIDIVMNLIGPCIGKIIDTAIYKKKKYIEYTNKVTLKYKRKKICVVDLGYSGTAQFYMSKVLEKADLTGFYFALSANIYPQSIGEETYSCYKKCNKYEKDKFPWLLLEAVLSAPHGQFLYFQDDGSPVYKVENITMKRSKQFEDISNGIDEYIKDFFNIFNKPKIKDFSYQLPLDIVLLLDKNYISPNSDCLDFFQIDTGFNGKNNYAVLKKENKYS